MTRYPACRVSIPWFSCVLPHKVAIGSKIACEMLCFPIETVVGGREGRRFRTGGCVGFSWVSGGIRFACGQITCKSQGLLPVGSQFPVFLWVSGVSSFACGQITCKSQGLLPVGSQFLGFSWVSGDVRFACGQTTCKSQGILSVGSILCVFVGVRGYPSFRSHKRKKMFLWLVEQTSCLITLALRIKRYISNNQIASKLSIYQPVAIVQNYVRHSPPL